MAQENRISLKITSEDKTKIENAIDVIEKTLKPYLIALKPDERHGLPKAADKTVAFLNKTKEFMESNPDLTPSFIDKDEYIIDLNATEELNGYYAVLNQIVSMLNDTMMLSASEAYVAALSYYGNAKNAAKLKIPGAKEVYDDLSKRFKGKS